VPADYLHDQRGFPRVHRSWHLLNLELRGVLPDDRQHSLHGPVKAAQECGFAQYEQHALLAGLRDLWPALRHNPLLLPDDGEESRVAGFLRGALPSAAI